MHSAGVSDAGLKRRHQPPLSSLRPAWTFTFWPSLASLHPLRTCTSRASGGDPTPTPGFPQRLPEALCSHACRQRLAQSVTPRGVARTRTTQVCSAAPAGPRGLGHRCTGRSCRRECSSLVRDPADTESSGNAARLTCRHVRYVRSSANTLYSSLTAQKHISTSRKAASFFAFRSVHRQIQRAGRFYFSG